MPRKGICKRGHPMVDPVTRMVNGKEHRQCRLCYNANMNARFKNEVEKQPERKPYTPDPNDADVQTFRLEAARRGIKL